jgi:hypothetical protein
MIITRTSAQIRPAGTSVIVALTVLGASLVAGLYFAGPAFADSHDSTGEIIIDGSHGDGSGGSGNHDDGHEEGDHEDGHTGGGPNGSGGHGEGGHGEGDGSGEGEGPKGEGSGAGGSGAGGQAGRPVWAGEGIPEVELGRLNVIRSPNRVIDRAYLEALGSFTSEMAAFYRLDLDQMIEELSENWDEVNFISSPLQNLALFRDALDGTSVLGEVGIETDNDTLLAVFLGTASDKEIPITPETAYAVSVILGQPLSAAEAEALAAEAEMVRQAILAGHG